MFYNFNILDIKCNSRDFDQGTLTASCFCSFPSSFFPSFYLILSLSSWDSYTPITFTISSGTKCKILNNGSSATIFKLFYFSADITCNFIADQVLCGIQNFIWVMILQFGVALPTITIV